MNIARRFLVSVLAGSFCISPLAAFAQGNDTIQTEIVSLSLVSTEPISVAGVDSFFDIFVDLQVPQPPVALVNDPDCEWCDFLFDLVMDKLADLADLGAQADKLLGQLDALELYQDFLRDELAGLEADLARMDSGDFVRDETTGETETARNQAARRAYRNDTYGQWQAGKIDSDEKMERDRHSYEMTEAELDRWYKQAKKDKENEMKKLKGEIDDVQDDIDDLNDDLDDIFDEMEKCDRELADLLDALEDCWDMCVFGPVDPQDDLFLPDDLFGPPLPLPPLHDGPFGGMKDWFFGPPEIPLLPPFPPFGILPLGPQDFVGPIPVPEVKCPLCDPLRDAIIAKKKAATALETKIKNMEKDLKQADSDLAQAERALEAAQNAWDRMHSSDFVRDENTGETETARNQAGRREFRNNNTDYSRSSSDLSGAQLEKWIKKAEARLKAELAAAKKKVNEARTKQKGIQDAIKKARDELTKCKKEIQDMIDALAECEKLCKDLDALNTLLGGVPVLPLQDGPPVIFPDEDDYDLPIFADGFESGDTSVWDTPKDDLDEEEELPRRGFMDWLKFGGDDEPDPASTGGDHLTVSNIGSSGQDGVSMEPQEGGSIFCDWFGWFCPKEAPITQEASSLNFDDLIKCSTTFDPGLCGPLDHNGNGTFDDSDLIQFKLSIDGPGELVFPLQINRFDGNDQLTLDDLPPARDCLLGDGPCDPIGIGDVPSDAFIGLPPILHGNDFSIIADNGIQIFLGQPRDDFIGINGADGIGPDGNPPPGFFGNDLPGSSNGADLLFFGATDLPGQGWPGDTPPLPPVVPQPETVPAGSAVPDVVKAAVERILRDNPPGPCETITVRYVVVTIKGRPPVIRITMTRRFDPAKCPPKSCPPRSFETIGAGPQTPAECAAACGFENADCGIIETLPNGNLCIGCVPGDEDIDLCANDRCSDGDECTEDYCDPETGHCTYTDINDDHCADEPFECPRGQLPAGECLRTCDGRCVEGENFHDPEGNQPDLNCSRCTSLAKCSHYSAGISCSDVELCTNGYDNLGDVQGEECCKCRHEEFARCEAPEVDERSACNCDSNEECALSNQTGCWYCRDKPQDDPPPQQCDSPLVNHAGATALETTGFECDPVQVGQLVCYRCTEVEDQDDGPSCPSGTTAEKSTCESSCKPEGGVCLDDNEDGCFECLVVNCPSGTTKNECPSSCSNGCDVVGEQHGVKCYQCKQSCEDVCANNDYGPPNTDHSNAILSELNGYSCVSGANISIQTATINGCSCIGNYSLSVNNTPPVCQGTPCGDVTCGGSATCQEGDTTITVNCNWGGWEKIDKHQFRPVVGN